MIIIFLALGIWNMPVIALSLKVKQIISFRIIVFTYTSIHVKNATFATGRINLGIFYSIDFISFLFLPTVLVYYQLQTKFAIFRIKASFH